VLNVNSSLPGRIINASKARLRAWSHAFMPSSPMAQRVESSTRSNILRPMPRRRTTQIRDTVSVQLPRARTTVPKAGIILPVVRLFVWTVGLLGFSLGNMIDAVMRRGSTQREAVRLRRVFEKAGGSAAKIGQQLSVRADLLPYAYCVELSHMLDNVPAFATSQAIAIIERNLGRRLDEVFSAFDPEPIGSASLACVYQAILKTGERVAVKVRRPRIGRMIAADLRAFGWLCNAAEALTLMRPGRTGYLVRDLRTILFDELNFRAEARYTDMFRRRSEKRGDVTAPKIYFEYSTDEVIVSELLSGIWMWELMAAVENDDHEFLHRARAMGIEPKSLARKLLSIMSREAMEESFHHADPHPANLIVLPNNRICYIDFGAIGRFSTWTKKGWRELQYRTMKGDISRMANASLYFIGDLPPADVDRLLNMTAQIFFDFVVAMISRDAEWWERSSAQIWIRYVELAQEFGLGLSVETIQLFRATLLYDSIITRLDKSINFGQEYAAYAKEIAKEAREHARNSAGKGSVGLSDTNYLALEQVADSSAQFFYKLLRGVEDPLVHFRNIVGKLSYTAVMLLRVGYLALAIAGVAALAGAISKGWFGHGVEWSALLLAVIFSNQWIALAAFVAVLVLIRHLVIRLNLPDKRVTSR
jgi:ubiquinone biosynthesis protein